MVFYVIPKPSYAPGQRETDRPVIRWNSAYNPLHMIHQFYVWGEEVRWSFDWLIKSLIKVGPGFLTTPGGGMSKWLRPFPCPIITGRCWLGFLRLTSRIASVRRGIGMPEIWKKLTLRPDLRYFASCEKDWLREVVRLGDFTRSQRLKKPFWDRGSQGCRIISVYKGPQVFGHR
jgi:hypothetical protein